MYAIEGFYTYWQVALQGSWSNLYHHDECKRVSVSPIGSIETDQSVSSLAKEWLFLPPIPCFRTF